MTIVGGILMGLTVQAAVEYSFLLGVLTLTAATAKKALWKVDGLDAYHHWCGGAHLMWDAYGLVPILIGLVAATLSAALAVKWLVSYLQSHGLSVFGWYRIAIGLAAAGLVLAGLVAA
jgi:undecaprenyl-diphosphatase